MRGDLAVITEANHCLVDVGEVLIFMPGTHWFVRLWCWIASQPLPIIVKCFKIRGDVTLNNFNYGISDFEMIDRARDPMRTGTKAPAMEK